MLVRRRALWQADPLDARRPALREGKTVPLPREGGAVMRLWLALLLAWLLLSVLCAWPVGAWLGRRAP